MKALFHYSHFGSTWEMTDTCQLAQWMHWKPASVVGLPFFWSCFSSSLALSLAKHYSHSSFLMPPHLCLILGTIHTCFNCGVVTFFFFQLANFLNFWFSSLTVIGSNMYCCKAHLSIVQWRQLLSHQIFFLGLWSRHFLFPDFKLYLSAPEELEIFQMAAMKQELVYVGWDAAKISWLFYSTFHFCINTSAECV